MNNISFAVVFDNPKEITLETLTSCLHAFNPVLREAKVHEIVDELPLFRITWDDHELKLYSFNSTLPTEVLDQCVACANYSDTIKREIYGHESHVLLSHQNENIPTLDRYVALALISAALVSMGAIGVLNENANSSFPAFGLISPQPQDQIEFLRTLPLPLLYCGSVVYQIEGTENLIIRTYGAERFGLPNLAIEFSPKSPENPEHLLSDIFDYCLATDKKISVGDTSEHGDHGLTFRHPREDEYFLIDPNSETIVLERSNK